MKKLSIMILALILFFGQSFATVRIVYDDDGSSKYYYDEDGRRYDYYDSYWNNKDYYYDRYGNKKYFTNDEKYRRNRDTYDYRRDDGDYYYSWSSYKNSDKRSLDYKFSHYPANIKKISYQAGYMPYIKYSGSVSSYIRKIDASAISDVQSYIENVGYFKFFRFSYYWDSILNEINDSRIDLDYLYKTKLDYPIMAFHIKNDVILFIHKNNLRESDKDRIDDYYDGRDFMITRYHDWYVVNVENEKSSDMTYKPSTYFNILKKYYRNYDLLTLQVGQDPFNYYSIENFSNNIMQVEIDKNDNLFGFVLSLKNKSQINAPKPTKTYSADYQKDSYIAQEMNALYTPIYNYFKETGSLPKDLGALSPSFTDITQLNRYNHELGYSTYDTYCFKVGFLPKSLDFKKDFISQINASGYWFNTFCVR